MPNKETKEESKFEKILKNARIPYESQCQFNYIDENDKIRYFYVDFILNNKLVVFIDGIEHKKNRQKVKDELQEMILERKRFYILRITNWDINNRDNDLFSKRLISVLKNIELTVENKTMY